MEEQQGMLSTKQNPENVYKVNIDLKVHGEELKKASIMIVTQPVCSCCILGTGGEEETAG